MSESVKSVNRFFRTAIKPEVDRLQEMLLLTDRQERIFNMYYIRKLDINFIADELGTCNDVINRELKTIRKKLLKALNM